MTLEAWNAIRMLLWPSGDCPFDVVMGSESEMWSVADRAEGETLVAKGRPGVLIVTPDESATEPVVVMSVHYFLALHVGAEYPEDL